jgi:8-oxo-dGTP diphosphatase
MQVVAAALVRDGRVLAARRSTPPELAGAWEFPGGKVEADETERDALARECSEELGIDVEVGAQLGTAGDDRIELALYAAILVSGEPAVGDDHDDVRWVGPHEIDGLPWLPIDRELLPAVTALLAAARS